MKSKTIFAIGLGILSIESAHAHKGCLKAEKVTEWALKEAIGNNPEKHYTLWVNNSGKKTPYKRTIKSFNAGNPGFSPDGKCIYHVKVHGTIQGKCGLRITDIHESIKEKFETPSIQIEGVTFHRSMLLNKYKLSNPRHQKDGSCVYDLSAEQFLQEVSK